MAVRPYKAPYVATIIWNYPLGANPSSTTLIAKDTVSDLALKEWQFQIPDKVPLGRQSIDVIISDPYTGASSKKTIWFEITQPSPAPSTDNILLYAAVAIILAVAVPVVVYMAMREGPSGPTS